jgi:HEAT repeat protein
MPWWFRRRKLAKLKSDLHSDDEVTQLRAAFCLIEIGDPDAVAAVISLARERVYHVSGDAGHLWGALQSLPEGLHHEDAHVRAGARVMLAGAKRMLLRVIEQKESEKRGTHGL